MNFLVKYNQQKVMTQRAQPIPPKHAAYSVIFHARVHLDDMSGLLRLSACQWGWSVLWGGGGVLLQRRHLQPDQHPSRDSALANDAGPCATSAIREVQ